MDFENLHQILRSLYDEMMPLCEDMAGVAKGIAGLGALFYVAYRVWQSLARAEPIDVFPMLRPFAIGLCIMFFPTVVLGTLSGVLSPIVQGTAKMLEAETLDMNEYREQKDKLEYEAMKRNPETAYLVSNEEFDKQLEELGWSPDDLVTMAGMYIERMQADPNFSLDSSDGVYIVFMIIGIIGYFTIPTVSGWIIQAGGMGNYGRNVNQTAGKAGGFAGSVAGATAGNVAGRVGKLLR